MPVYSAMDWNSRSLSLSLSLSVNNKKTISRKKRKGKKYYGNNLNPTEEFWASSPSLPIIPIRSFRKHKQTRNIPAIFLISKYRAPEHHRKHRTRQKALSRELREVTELHTALSMNIYRRGMSCQIQVNPNNYFP